MTGNWGAPGQQPPPAGYGYNWGVAYPIGYQPVAWIPRPPRPGVVKVAVTLTVLGVLISGVQIMFDLVNGLGAQRDQIVAQLRDTGNPAPDNLADTAVNLGIVFAVLFWLLPAAAAMVNALLARRGFNPSRIVLAILMGVFALNDLCGGIFGLVNVSMNGTRIRVGTASLIVDLILAIVAVAVGVLVLVPAANRFFSAGPGRRFMPST